MLKSLQQDTIRCHMPNACFENLQIPRPYVNTYKSFCSIVTAGAYVAFGYERSGFRNLPKPVLSSKGVFQL